jgi:hypothetical protein
MDIASFIVCFAIGFIIGWNLPYEWYVPDSSDKKRKDEE